MVKRVVALGFFDGVHTGHGELLKRTRAVAEELGCVPSVLTYSKHPSEIVGKEPVKLINTTEERCALITELYGIEDIIIKDFTREYSQMTCEEFVEHILEDELCAKHTVAGYDFRFGRGGEGDARELSRLCSGRGIGCSIIPEVRVGAEAVSSSRIRGCISGGDMKSAAELLGHPHCIISQVEHGRNLGEKLGFPTVNQSIGANIQLPRFGVYLSDIELDGKKHRGVTNIGVRPTVTDSMLPRAETHILDFSGNVYGKTVKLELLSFIRGEMKFESVEKLRAQIEDDVKIARVF